MTPDEKRFLELIKERTLPIAEEGLGILDRSALAYASNVLGVVKLVRRDGIEQYEMIETRKEWFNDKEMC